MRGSLLLILFSDTVPLNSSGIVELENFYLRILYSFCLFGEYAESIYSKRDGK
jgi:hypothetical protein